MLSAVTIQEQKKKGEGEDKTERKEEGKRQARVQPQGHGTRAYSWAH